MDFTNLEEKAREAKLDYGEAESLARFLNFQRERRGEPPVPADYGQLCELLSEIHLEVEFRADGIGVIKEDSWYEFFEHELDLENVRRDCENDRDAINDFLQDHFNEHIGPEMEDPFFDPSGEDCELYFETGSNGELERLMKLFILTELEIEAHEDEEVRLYAAMEESDPHL